MKAGNSKPLLWLFLTMLGGVGGVHAATAIASIPGDAGHNTVSSNFPNQKAAEKDAISGCTRTARENSVKGKCKIVLSIPGPGYVAIAYGDDGTGYGKAETSREAVDVAAQFCQKKYNNCQTEDIHYWADDVGVARKQPVNVAGSCIPRSAYRQCKSQCINGDCLVTYMNGCQVRVQVSPQFNSFNNQWEYPAPDC